MPCPVLYVCTCQTCRKEKYRIRYGVKVGDLDEWSPSYHETISFRFVSYFLLLSGLTD